MTDIKESIKDMNLEELRDFLADRNDVSSINHYAKVEFLYRQTNFIKEQAKSATESGNIMKRNSCIMLWTLIFIGISAIAQLIIAISNTL